MAKHDFTQFYDYLFEHTPEWDEKVLRGMFEPYICPLPCDVRLLPNRLRKVYARELPKLRSKHRRKLRTTRRFFRKREIAVTLLDQRLEQWISSLPKRRQAQERKRRMVDPQDSWIGQVEVGQWDAAGKTLSHWEAVHG